MEAMESEQTESATHCYCSATELDADMIACSECKKRFHSSCMRKGRPSPLAGDVYFTFVCENCSPDGTEVIKRKKLQWTLVIMLALYNLQLQGGGKCGYYRWREHICRFIDKNWGVFFGDDRKKSATWHGTVAGSLSTGANRFFVSGMEVLSETGWWSLKSSRLPTLEELESITLNMKASRKRQAPAEAEVSPVLEGSRKKHQNVVEAAVALKEKKTGVAGDSKPSKPKKKKEPKAKTSDASSFPFKHKIKLVVSQPESTSSSRSLEENPKRGIPKIIIKKEKESLPSYDDEDLNLWIKEPQMELDLDIEDEPPDMFDLPNSLDGPEPLSSLFDGVLSEISYDKVSVKQEYESEEESSNSSKTVGMTKKFHHPDTSRKRKAVTKDESPVKEITYDSKFTLMSPYEEEQLLQKLENHPLSMSERPEVRRLYRKLKVRKLKRERKLPVFDLDVELRTLRGMDLPDYTEREDASKPSVPTPAPKLNTILDRYQSTHYSARGKSQQHASFVTRLMGLEDEEQTSIVSPYTERILKPYIFRDISTKPLKVRLLEEILTRTNKHNPEWNLSKQSPIDYCYVRPQHIPGVNALCQEFFWPGIDMSESLQYPDFSCVALYKKIIIGFAFMVPDVKFNEAYITFIFCHPEWRRSGIATFMLYHLIQTCMGKDVTLHVSATSSAVFLYQKFGFKVEEFIHDFYDKYLPPDSKECRHALFLRLSR